MIMRELKIWMGQQLRWDWQYAERSGRREQFLREKKIDVTRKPCSYVIYWVHLQIRWRNTSIGERLGLETKWPLFPSPLGSIHFTFAAAACLISARWCLIEMDLALALKAKSAMRRKGPAKKTWQSASVKEAGPHPAHEIVITSELKPDGETKKL